MHTFQYVHTHTHTHTSYFFARTWTHIHTYTHIKSALIHDAHAHRHIYIYTYTYTKRFWVCGGVRKAAIQSRYGRTIARRLEGSWEPRQDTRHCGRQEQGLVIICLSSAFTSIGLVFMCSGLAFICIGLVLMCIHLVLICIPYVWCLYIRLLRAWAARNIWR